MNILIVEDDEKMAKLLQVGLKDQGVVSDHVLNGEVAIERLGDHDYDAVVLDIMLPGKLDGFGVCKEIRQRNIGLPVIMVSARESIEDRVHGLDVGADDYLPKPFSLAEFLARIRALVRRGRSLDQPTLQAIDLTLDPARHTVERSGQQIKLSKKEFRLLEYLMRNKDKVVTRTMIIEHVWGYKINYTNKLVDVYINYLRKKIDEGFPRPLLKTVRGVGYSIRG